MAFTWLIAPVAGANDAAQIIESLFGDRIKAVQRTATRSDDVALAAQMIETARGDTVNEAMRAALCDKACDLAQRDASGSTTILEAIRLWPCEGTAEKRAAIRDRHVELLTRAQQLGRAEDREAAGTMLLDTLMTAGDERMEDRLYDEAIAAYRRAAALALRVKPDAVVDAKAALDAAMHRQRVTRSIDLYRTKLLEDRSNVAVAEALIKLYLIDEQNPQAAQPYLEIAIDAKLKTAALSLKDANSLSVTESATLGEWLMDETVSLPASSQAAALAIAKGHFERAYAQQDADNLTRTKAKLQITEIESRLAKLTAASTPRRPAPTQSVRKINPILANDAIIILTFDKKTISEKDGKWLISDVSKGKHQGVLEGTKPAAGIIGEALLFDGVNDSIVVESLTAAMRKDLKELTLAVWVKPADENKYGFVFAVGNNPYLSITLRMDGGLWEFCTPISRNGAATKSTSSIKPQWQHVVATWDGKEQRIYVNGTLEGKTSVGNFTLNGDSISTGVMNDGMVGYDKARIGAQAKVYQRASGMFKGEIDEFAMFAKSLSESHVKQLFDVGRKSISKLGTENGNGDRSK